MLLPKPGVYKVIWHNTYSYLKAKTLKYRLRILEKKEESKEVSHVEDLFTINELNEKEDRAYRSLKQVYNDVIPIVKLP